MLRVLTRGRLLALLRKQIAIIGWDDSRASRRITAQRAFDSASRNRLKIRRDARMNQDPPSFEKREIKRSTFHALATLNSSSEQNRSRFFSFSG